MIKNIFYGLLTCSSIIFCLPIIFTWIGLSSIGPIAGGLFSTMQGSGIVAGSSMAILQYFSMSGWISFLQGFVIKCWLFYGFGYTLIKKIKSFFIK